MSYEVFLETHLPKKTASQMLFHKGVHNLMLADAGTDYAKNLTLKRSWNLYCVQVERNSPGLPGQKTPA